METVNWSFLRHVIGDLPEGKAFNKVRFTIERKSDIKEGSVVIGKLEEVLSCYAGILGLYVVACFDAE